MTDREIAVVVGAGQGLGAGLARRFAEAGMAVALARRDADKIAGLAKEIGGRAYACDATEQSAVAALFEGVMGDLGRPTLVVFNAGAYRPGRIVEIDPDDFER